MFIGLLGRKTAAASLADAPRRVLDELKEIRLVDVVLPTRQGIDIRKRCVARRLCIYVNFVFAHNRKSANVGL